MTREEKWEEHVNRVARLTEFGINNGLISIYDEKVIRKLRTIYEGGLPASILLLSRIMVRYVKCEDFAIIMAKAFLEEEGDVKVVYASIESLRLNPNYPESEDLSDSYHAFVERTTSDGKSLIYDVASGLVIDKSLYWRIQDPIVIQEVGKDKIAEIDLNYKRDYPEGEEQRLDATFLYLSLIEQECNMSQEFSFGILQREIQLFKNLLDPEALQALAEEMQGFKLKKVSHM